MPCLKAVTSSTSFEMVFALLIILNTVSMAFEAQYVGIQSGFELKFDGIEADAASTWPGAKTAFYVLELFFGVAFTFEVLVKMAGERADFVRSSWNWFDTVIVSLWLFNTLFEVSFAVNPMFLRIARMARLLRLLRFVRAFQVFDVLHVLVGCIKGCASVLLWASVLLSLIILCAALVLTLGLELYIRDEASPVEERMKVYEYFGTFTRGALSVFELTFGNWVPITRVFHEYVAEWLGMSMLLYRGLIGEGLLKVVTGVFLFETFKAAHTDDELMILQRERQASEHVKKITRLFEEADVTGNGELTFADFLDITNDPRVRTWLQAMELDVQDTEKMFQLVDVSGDGSISAEELVTGVGRLKGPARAVDLAALIKDTVRLRKDVAVVKEKIELHAFLSTRHDSETSLHAGNKACSEICSEETISHPPCTVVPGALIEGFCARREKTDIQAANILNLIRR